ncbi:hypothetical protein GUJ93_ZPchr0006g44414 [Zizania palustris]|uniref:Uncharacterized protein n=1 Tax=Zizania palustris TaxID=103762 RepID=A0A8J5T944_ZIZPA|nr:hypothetical protein GUJ93_ZPchr0006g44414 [Zizania palustris]
MCAEERRSSARDEMEAVMAADDQRHQMMGCSPLGRMISRVITKCRGRKGRMRWSERMDYGAKAYPPAQTCYVRPAARTVTFTTANAEAMPLEPMRAHAMMDMPGAPFAAATPHLQGGGGGGKPRKKKKSKSKQQRVRFAPAGAAAPVPTDAPPPHAAHAHHHAAAAAAAAASGAGQFNYEHPSTAAAEPYSQSQVAASHGYGRYAYVPSPLARWEMLGTPRRHEYFSGEYRWYYPTPVREGIYSLATDANRLTTIFSEENPNACAIV